jgi:Ca2+/Na+ antiporter
MRRLQEKLCSKKGRSESAIGQHLKENTIPAVEKFEKVASILLAFITMFAFILGSRLYFIALMIYYYIFTCSLNCRRKRGN